MSAETLKFFEDKSTESIINWMLSHLSEEQIRMCLDQSGKPDLSAAPTAAAAAGSAPVQTITLPDGTQKQLQPGEGSSTDPLPTPAKPDKQPRKSASQMFLDRYRKKCIGTQYLIKDVSKDGVEYYEFKEVEDTDLPNNPGLTVGDASWTFQKTPLNEFKDYCTDEDREVFEILKEENPTAFNNPPPGAIEVSNDYQVTGIPSPLPTVIPTEPIDVSPAEDPPLEPVVEITEPIRKALAIQRNSKDFIQQNYPELFAAGLSMFPVFIYGSNGNNVLFLYAAVQDDKLVLKEGSVNKSLLNNRFRTYLKNIDDARKAGLYNPTDNIPMELDSLLPDSDIKNKIQYIYTNVTQFGVNYFGTLEDDEPEWLKSASEQLLPDSQESFDMLGEPDDLMTFPDPQESFENIPEAPNSGFEMSDITEALPPVPKRTKKVTDMTIPEIEQRMREQFGAQYVKEFKPVIYVNSLGVKNVKYIKRNDCPPCDCDDEMEVIERPKFTEFQGKPSVNSGVGRFGDMDDDEELLFF